MLDTLFQPAFIPFTFALGLFFGLLALEIVFAFIGFSLVGDSGDLDLDVAEVPDIADLGDMGVEIDLPDAADYDIPDMATAEAEISVDASGPMAWLGMGKTPFVIWLASLLMSFGLAGIILQTAWLQTIGWTLPVLIAAAAATVAAVWFTRAFGSVFARILPKTESTSLSTRRYGGHQGVVTQGTARRGHPAEVRLTDRFGNFHYLRAEPAKDDDSIPAGTNVIILRNIRTGVMRLVPLG